MKKYILPILLSLLVIAGAIGTYYFYTKYQDTQAKLSDPAYATEAEKQAILSKIGNSIELPDENPQLATVLDKDKLKEQPYIALQGNTQDTVLILPSNVFANTENGDKLLLYPVAKKAIIFRESTNKIVEFSPLFEQTIPSSSPTSSVAPKPEPVPENTESQEE